MSNNPHRREVTKLRLQILIELLLPLILHLSDNVQQRKPRSTASRQRLHVPGNGCARLRKINWKQNMLKWQDSLLQCTLQRVLQGRRPRRRWTPRSSQPLE